MRKEREQLRGNKIKNRVVYQSVTLHLSSQASYSVWSSLLCLSFPFIGLGYSTALIIGRWFFSNVFFSNYTVSSVFRWACIKSQFKYLKLLTFFSKSGTYVLWVSICSLDFQTCQRLIYKQMCIQASLFETFYLSYILTCGLSSYNANYK